MTVTLIGMRGTGKSSIGRHLANQLGWLFFDADEQIVSEAGRSIAEIFSTDGEARFREIEACVMQNLLTRDEPSVVAAGGGAILASQSSELMKAAGPVVWLTAPTDVLASRLSADEKSSSQRPSLTGKTLTDELDDVLRSRRRLYQAAATITVPTDIASPIELARDIAARLENQLGECGSRLPTEESE